MQLKIAYLMCNFKSKNQMVRYINDEWRLMDWKQMQHAHLLSTVFLKISEDITAKWALDTFYIASITYVTKSEQ